MPGRSLAIEAILALLAEAPPRMATVMGSRQARVRTVSTYAQWRAIHERPHFKQIERIVNAMRRRQQPPDRCGRIIPHPADCLLQGAHVLLQPVAAPQKCPCSRARRLISSCHLGSIRLHQSAAAMA